MQVLIAASARLRRWGLVTAVILPVTASFGAASAFGATIADWEMNESSGARTMHDSSGSGISGTIGSAVVTGVVTDGAKGYRWRSENRSGSAHPERLVKVSSSKLNPGTANFSVVMRFNTGSFGDENLIQKGQATTNGGQWKIGIKNGKIVCNFLGVKHRSAVWSNQIVANNKWHTIRCNRRTTGVTITIDGGTPKTNHHWTGSISNTWPVTIGGKLKCNQQSVECDYYVGRIDRIAVMR
jgi:hypothetical protein